MATLSRRQQYNIATGAVPQVQTTQTQTTPVESTSNITGTNLTKQSNQPQVTSNIGGAVLPDGTITQNGTTPISTSVLEGAKTFSVPQVKSTEAQTNLGMKVAPGTPTVTTPEAPKSASQLVSEQISSLSKAQGEQSAFTAQAQEEAGLEEKRLALQELDRKSADITLKYQSKIDELKKNPEGFYGGQLNAAVEQLEGKRDQELANIDIRRSVAQGDVNTALALVKDKVDAKFEPIKNQIETLKAQYSMVQNDMSESEKMEAQAEITKQTQAYQKQRDEEQFAQTLKLQALKDGITITSDNPDDIVAEYAIKTGGKKTKEQIKADEAAKAQLPVLTQKIADIDKLILLTEDGTAAVGPNAFARFGDFNKITGATNDFIAGVDQLTKRETLDTLINLKAQGGTLGALSDAERQMLEAAASKIGSWRVTDKETGKTLFYNTTEASFKKELETIKSLAQKAVNKAYGFDKSNDDFLASQPDAVVTNSDFFNQY